MKRIIDLSRRYRLSAAAMTLIAIGCSASAARAGDRLTYSDLVARLTSPEHLATLPAPGETCAEVSSYDRASRYDAATRQYVNWGANGDGGFTAGKDGDKFVLADLKGPGCIWRLWSARAQEGHVRIYIDGAAEPVTDLPFARYFDGSAAPFNRPALVYTASSGQNSYVPIPYQKSCRIVADAGWGKYYQATYSKFPSGTVVPSFKGDFAGEDAAALDKANAVLESGLGADPAGHRAGEKVEAHDLVIPAGQAVALPELNGPAAITALKVRAEYLHAADAAAALREMTISIRWDGQARPAVWSPLGDFFSTTLGPNAYKSLLSGCTAEGFYSYWYMPFRSARIEFGNDGRLERKLHVEVTYAPVKGGVDQLARFHAKWHRDFHVPERADRWPDWTVLEAKGRGRFCGMMLHVWNPRAGHNPQFGRDGSFWWGEGDEKLFVDGESFPSWFGTGTEDFFGYAWCDPTLFQKAYHGQTLTQNNRGHQSVFRHLVTDNVPFQKSFEGCLEKYFPNSWPTLYACTVFFYLDPTASDAGTDPYAAVPLGEREGYYDLIPALEGENLKVESLSGSGTTERQFLGQKSDGGGIWSGLEQLWWKGGKAGDKLTLAVPVTYDGTYRVRIGMTRAPDYAIAQLEFAGVRPLAPIDFWSARESSAVEIYIGTYQLSRGTAPLVVQITGANEKARPGMMLGIDYVKLEPVCR